MPLPPTSTSLAERATSRRPLARARRIAAGAATGLLALAAATAADFSRMPAAVAAPPHDSEGLAPNPPTPTPPTPTPPTQRQAQRQGQVDIAYAPATTARLFEGLPWDYCGPRPARLGPYRQPPPVDPLTPIDVDAGGLIHHRDTRVTELLGGVHLQRGPQEIDTETLRLDHTSGQVTAPGKTYLAYPGIRLLGEHVQVNLDTDQGQVSDAEYRLGDETNMRGQAKRIEIASRERMHLEDVRYLTSCKPGNNSWSLHARELNLDQASGRGTARHAQLRIRDVPVLYSPWLSFPLDNRRKSGFLVPSLGNSDETGFDLTLPYYLNLAPNMDATLYPRYMSKRGVMLGGEFRYLTRRDRGTISGEIIPNDNAYDKDSGTRGALHVEQSGLFWKRFGTYVDYNVVSDDDYLEDFGNSLDVTSTRYLTQRGDLSYIGDGWTLSGSVQAYQTVDQDIAPENRPYNRLPQILLTTKNFAFGPGLRANIQAEYDYFEHDDLVHGQRVTLSPRMSWPLRRSYGHLIPSLGVHLSQYQLEEQDEGLPDNPGHIIPSFDLDGRLVFERDIDWLGNSAIQTLEPRLFYLYTPYEDQSETPVFDSSELDFSFSNLFRSNRFTGRDRIGDANQLTLGLTSRTLGSASGEEIFRASIGHIVYFDNRRVQISGTEETRAGSPLAGEIAAKLLDHWHGRASVLWDSETGPENTNWQKRALELEYRQPNNNRLLNLAYRFDEGTSVDTSYEDTDVSFRWPINQGRAELVGRWLYSAQHRRTMEAFAGVEFGQCCWRLRVLGHHFKNSPDDTGSNSVMVQLELAGLGSIGNSIDSFLRREIHDYSVN